MPGLTSITIIKRDPEGAEIWRYTGVLLERGPSVLRLEARFNRPNLPFQDIVLKENDRFLETFYTDRWYNIFEIHDREDDRVKGWYCNIGQPAVLEADDRLSYVDLALDLWVDSRGNQTVLDEDEFAALELDAVTRRKARAALRELQRYFSEKR
jgi:predicted RNA-binding protein associated with RNAse of E/G family